MNIGSHDVQVFPTPQAVAQAAADVIVDAAAGAIAARRRFSIVLSGGSTPKLLYQILASDAYRERIDWAKVEVFFGDERAVAPNHPDSNYKLAADELLSKVPADRRNVHRMEAERPAEEAAQEYGRLLRTHFGDVKPAGGPDVTLLGMGDDGHTASLFPHTPAVKEPRHRCVGQFVEKSTTGASWRVTMTAPFINSSRLVLPLITGANKAARLKEVLTGVHDPERLPMQLIEPAQMTWLIDEAAAAELRE